MAERYRLVLKDAEIDLSKIDNKTFKITKVGSDYFPGIPTIIVKFKVGNKEGKITVEGHSPIWEETKDLAQAYAEETGADFEEVNINYLNYKTNWEDQGFMHRFDEAMDELGIDDEETRNSLLESINEVVEKEIKKSWSYNQEVVNNFDNWCRKNSYSIEDSKFRDAELVKNLKITNYEVNESTLNRYDKEFNKLINSPNPKSAEKVGDEFINALRRRRQQLKELLPEIDSQIRELDTKIKAVDAIRKQHNIK